jgi:hypothetical protein
MNPSHDSVQTWTETDCAWTPWSEGAQRGSVMIDADVDGAVAIVLDDARPPRFYRVVAGRIPAFLAAALQAWSGGTAEAVTVLWRRRLAPTTKGRVPGPPPPPLSSDDALVASAWVAYHAMVASVELAARRARAALGA